MDRVFDDDLVTEYSHRRRRKTLDARHEHLLGSAGRHGRDARCLRIFHRPERIISLIRWWCHRNQCKLIEVNENPGVTRRVMAVEMVTLTGTESHPEGVRLRCRCCRYRTAPLQSAMSFIQYCHVRYHLVHQVSFKWCKNGSNLAAGWKQNPPILRWCRLRAAKTPK